MMEAKAMIMSLNTRMALGHCNDHLFLQIDFPSKLWQIHGANK